MQQGGQYGVPPEVPPPQYTRASSASTAGNANNTHAHLFNLSHDVAAAAGGLGLSSNSPSLSHSAGQHHHSAHSYSLGQAHHHHHHPLHQQPASVSTQPYLHFQDHLSAQPQQHHHHHQQSIQSSSHTSQQQQQQQQQQIDHSAAASSSSAGLHLHQSQKQAMVPSLSVNVHAGQEALQLQQSSILQQQYSQQQQQHHNLGLGLESSNPSLSSLQQQASRGAQQQASPTSSTPTNNMITSTTSVAPLSSTITAPAAPTMIPSSAAAAPAVMNVLHQLTSNKGLQAAMADHSGLDETDGLGDIEGDKGGGGNRWPRQETLALLKVRSEMDSSFRDSSLKRPLWDEVSRKLAELGYQRSAKKCKEKFENVHKYYKRTKEGKAGRQDGKNYRFFSELEALYGNAGHTQININAHTNLTNASIFRLNPRSTLINDDFLGSPGGNTQARGDNLGRSSASFFLGSSLAGTPSRTSDLSTRPINPASFARPLIADATGLKFSSDTSSSDDDENDDEYEDPSEAAPDSKKRKRKSVGRMMTFFESLLKQVVEKQEQMQQRFLDALERREQDRMIREEAWKRQEMARMSREHDLRAQERSLAATRDAAIAAFLQKVTGQPVQLPTSTALAIAAQPVQSHAPPVPLHTTLDPTFHHISEDQDPFDPNSKRWPKPEVLALIKLRTGLHSRFTEPGPKGPLWEEIANSMSRLGYSRNAKRCKEKWENINKYFKKAKESNKNRPENAKTCPYYHQLDALYKQGVLGSGNLGNNIKALTYKPSSDNLDGTESAMQAHQTSGRGSREGELVAHGSTSADQVLATMPPASQLSTASDATASTGNENVSTVNAGTAVARLFSVSHPDGGGDLMNKNINLQPNNISPVRAVDVNIDTKVVLENPSRVESSTEDMAARSTLQMQHGIDDIHHHRSTNQVYEHKVDLEQDASLVDEDEAHPQQKHVLLQQQNVAHQTQLQYEQVIVPPGLITSGHSSFITNMLQKFSNDPAESNTSTTSTNQEQ